MHAPEVSRFDAAALARRLLVVFAALVNSVLLLGVPLWFATGGGNAKPPAWDNVLVQAFAAGALGVLIAAKIIFGKLTGGDALLDAARKGDSTLSESLQAAHVTAFALSEAAALFGFVAGMLTNSWMVFLPFGGAALVSMAFYFPSKGRLRALVEPVLRRAGMMPA